jgi:hypothetical protein
MTSNFDRLVQAIKDHKPRQPQPNPLLEPLSRDHYARMVRPSRLAKALDPMIKRAKKISAQSNELLARVNTQDRRALCAEFNAQATALAKAGEFTAEQGAIVDVLLHRFAAGLS